MKNEIMDRLIGKTRLSLAEKLSIREKKLISKDYFENNNMGDFQSLYPLKRGICEKDDILMNKYDLIN